MKSTIHWYPYLYGNHHFVGPNKPPPGRLLSAQGRGQGQRQDQSRHRDEFEDGDHHGIHAAHGAAETGGTHDGQPAG